MKQEALTSISRSSSQEHILEMGKAIEEDGVEVLGYLTWAYYDLPPL